MKLFVNFLLFGSFIALASVTAFYPLSLVRVSSPISGLSILGESTGPNSLQVTREAGTTSTTVSVSGKAYSGQNSYYNNAFKVENNGEDYQSYKLAVLRVYPLSKSVVVEVRPGDSDIITVAPGQSVPVGILVKSQSDSLGQPFEFTARISVIPVN